MLFSGKAPLIGLDVGSAAVKAVELAGKAGRVVARHAAIAPTPAGAISDGIVLDLEAAAEAIRKMCKEQKLRGNTVALALAGSDVLVTRIRIEGPQDKGLPARVRAEAARLSPFPMQNACLDFQVIDTISQSGWVETLLVAASDAKVTGIKALAMRTGRDLRIVDAAACALANAYEYNYEPDPGEIAALAHIGAAWVTVCVVRGGTLLVAKDLPLAAKEIKEEEWSVAERAAVQVERVFELMDERADDRPLEPRSAMVKKLVLSGGGARAKGLDELLRKRFGLAIEEMNPFRRIEFEHADSIGRMVWEHLHCLPVAVGLALRGIGA